MSDFDGHNAKSLVSITETDFVVSWIIATCLRRNL